ncbi:MAG: aspartyl/glutamyl-tRNA amidotransferase subunit A [Ignavibacteria bacterium RIFCSPLOWO2_12_FULL_56_21]|nr:MAG: aspartyl/glutamyl-tRNA amidotransferase subunit A [Ignavibacteria bacterium RIFCSPHIGHO2_02_FULL_56_12]OGU71546.1 MAG: aspartyl/glutamyl-tRNA amidotransferase subunit A [Ignavibacteria bacterium RIFCSPLOWO2_12_FULL_56_21]
MRSHESIHADLAAGRTTVESVVTECLASIERQRSLNAFLSVFHEEAVSQARAVDKKVSAGTAGPLAGMVVSIKDVICVKGHRATCGSKILENFVAPYDATVVARLKDADAVIVGKCNMDEFAMGSSTENSAFGRVHLPQDVSRIPGGSSGGSAVSVRAGMATTSLGTDTGGSIRQPAAFTGVVGLKPTYGRVSRYGLIAFASSFDSIGPFGSTVHDVASVLQVIAGKDPNDATSSDVPVPDYRMAMTGNVKGLRIGLPKEYYGDGLDPHVRKAVEVQVEKLRKQGAVISEVSLPHTEYTIAAYYILATAEASSNLARYDGARYGFRSKNAGNLTDMYVASRSEGFGAEVKRRIMLGTYVLSAGYYDAYYRKGQKVRRLIKNDFANVFKSVDCLITPTAPTTAFRAGEKTDDPLQMYLSDIYTVSANLAGIPGISLPCGNDPEGLPIGIQVLGKEFDEATVLRVAHALETP